MEDFQKRMAQEHEQLANRIMALGNFLQGEKFKELPDVEKADLICQEHAMVLYERFLGSRCMRAGIFEEIAKQAEANNSSEAVAPQEEEKEGGE